MNFIGIDLETQRRSLLSSTGFDGSLEPYAASRELADESVSGDHITVFCASSTKENLISMRYPDGASIRSYLDELDPEDTVLVAHNLIFETGWLCNTKYNLYDSLSRFRWLDSMLVLKRWNMMRGLAKFAARQKYDLKTWVGRFYPKYSSYFVDIDFKDPVTDKLVNYCALDAYFCAKIAAQCFSELSELEQKASFMEGFQCLEMGLAWISGLHLDTEYIYNLEKLSTQDLIDKIKLCDLAEDTLNSPTQLRNYLFDQKGLAPKVRTKPSKTYPVGQASTSKKALTIAAREYSDPQLTNILSYRQTRTERKKFIDGAIKALEWCQELEDGYGTIHPAPRVAASYTGRGSYSTKVNYKPQGQAGIALHQIPRAKSMRRMIIAPPGYVIAALDFAQQEIRLIAHESKDSAMLDIFTANEDFHAHTAAALLGYSYTDFMVGLNGDDLDRIFYGARFLGKVCGLSLNYRLGIATGRDQIETQYGLNLTLEEMKEAKDTYLERYPGVSRYWYKAINLAARRGYAVTVSGRRIKLDDLSDYGQQQTAINFPIQGTGADMKLLGINVISPLLSKMFGRFYFELHDCFFLLLPDNASLRDNLLELKYALSNLPYKEVYGWEPICAMPVDCKYGQSWATLKDLV
jgi:DNA polymerase I-like protein with 3'-5' exonuclease and polymerase domains